MYWCFNLEIFGDRNLDIDGTCGYTYVEAFYSQGVALRRRI